MESFFLKNPLPVIRELTIHVNKEHFLGFRKQGKRIRAGGIRARARHGRTTSQGRKFTKLIYGRLINFSCKYSAVGPPVVFHIWLCGNKTRAELEKEDKVRLTVNNPSAKVR